MMFGFPLSLKAVSIATVIAFTLGGVVGWRVEKAFSDSRWYRAKLAASEATVKTLNGRIAAMNAAAQADADRAVKDAAEILRLEGEKGELESKIGAGACLSDADVGELRRFWRAKPKK